LAHGASEARRRKELERCEPKLLAEHGNRWAGGLAWGLVPRVPAGVRRGRPHSGRDFPHSLQDAVPIGDSLGDHPRRCRSAHSLRLLLALPRRSGVIRPEQQLAFRPVRAVSGALPAPPPSARGLLARVGDRVHL
jgi:hypothetical protein